MAKTDRLLPVLAVLLLAMLACDSAPNKPGSRNDFTYHLNGFAIADYNRGLSVVALDAARDGLPLKSAVVRLGSDTLDWTGTFFSSDSMYYLLRDPASTLSGTNIPLVVTDSTFNTNTFPVTVPGAFSILTVEPPNRIVTGLQPVSVSWSGSSSATGYVLSAVRRPYAYTGTGYSTFVTSLNPAGTLPPDAFSLSPGPLPDTGWYYIFVYAYTGSLDSSFTRVVLPVPMPDTVSANIADDPWFGSVGTAVIAHRDSVHVVTQP